MTEKNGTKILLAFLAGAAVGAAVGYFLNSDKKDELLADLKEGFTDLKDEIGEKVEQAKDIIDALKNPVTEAEPESQA